MILKKTTDYNNNNKFQKIWFYHAYFSKFVVFRDLLFFWNLLFFEICCFLKFAVSFICCCFWNLLFSKMWYFWNLLLFKSVVFSNLLLLWSTPICCHQVVDAYFLQNLKIHHIYKVVVAFFDREKFLGVHRIRNCIWLFWMFWLSFVITFSNFSWFEWFSLFLMILMNWYEIRYKKLY